VARFMPQLVVAVAAAAAGLKGNQSGAEWGQGDPRLAKLG